jgi:hypothetical protein
LKSFTARKYFAQEHSVQNIFNLVAGDDCTDRKRENGFRTKTSI